MVKDALGDVETVPLRETTARGVESDSKDREQINTSFFRSFIDV